VGGDLPPPPPFSTTGFLSPSTAVVKESPGTAVRGVCSAVEGWTEEGGRKEGDGEG